MSRGIVEAHGGSLSLAPPDGDGACFVIRLPLARDSARLSDLNGAIGAPPRLTPVTRTVLVVDDEPEKPQVIKTMRGAGYMFVPSKP